MPMVQTYPFEPLISGFRSDAWPYSLLLQSAIDFFLIDSAKHKAECKIERLISVACESPRRAGSLHHLASDSQ